MGPFCLFSVRFCFSFEGSVGMDRGHCRVRGEGTLTLVVVGRKGGLVGVMDLGTARECWSAPGVTWCLGTKGEEYRA